MAANTRRQILLSIREQARLLCQAAGAPLGAPDHWSSPQWWEAFNFLFVARPADGTAPQEHQDDLLFFVHRRSAAPAAPPSAAAAAAPVFVRRKTGAVLPDDLQLSGPQFGAVDWAATVLLNLVLHSQYRLTVVACGPDELPFVAEGRTWGSSASSASSVSKPVFACTTVTPVNLADSSGRGKDSAPAPCYPDVCFAVDNFDDAFDDMVLEDASRCYCVVLQALLDHEQQQQQDDPQAALDPAADVAARISSQQQQQQQQPAGGAGSSASWQIQSGRKRTLFAGYVSFEQIAAFLDSGSAAGGRAGGSGAGSLLQALLRGGAQQQQQQQAPRNKVVMTGPGGVGRCEVAVTRIDAGKPAVGDAGNGAGSGGDSPVLPAAASAAGGAAAVQQQQQQAAARGGGSPARLSLLQRAWQAAAGVQQAPDSWAGEAPSHHRNDRSGSSTNTGGASSSSSRPDCHMLCALMSLRLPAQFLAQELLEAAAV